MFVLCTQAAQQALATHQGPLRATNIGWTTPTSISGYLLSLFPLHFLLVLRGHISRRELFSEQNTLHFLWLKLPSFLGKLRRVPGGVLCRCLLDAGLGIQSFPALCSHRAFPDIVVPDSYLFHHSFTETTFSHCYCKPYYFCGGCISVARWPMYKLAFVPKCLNYCFAIWNEQCHKNAKRYQSLFLFPSFGRGINETVVINKIILLMPGSAN